MKLPGRLNLKRSIWWYLGSFLVTLGSLAIVAYLVYKNRQALLEVKDNISIWPFLAAFPLFCLGELLASLAWGRIMNDLTTPLPMRRHQMIFVVTHAARRLPGTVWHVIGRVAWYDRLGISKAVTTFANVLETVLILWSGLVLAVLIIPFAYPAQSRNAWIYLAGLVITGVVIHPRFMRWILRRTGHGEQAASLTYRKVLVWLVFYLAIWLNGGAILFLVIRGIYPIPLSLLPLSVAAWCLTGVAGTLVLLLPSGLGVGEATLSLILSTQIPSAIAVAAALLMRLLLTVLEFLFAAVVFFFSDFRKSSLTPNPSPLDRRSPLTGRGEQNHLPPGPDLAAASPPSPPTRGAEGDGNMLGHEQLSIERHPSPRQGRGAGGEGEPPNPTQHPAARHPSPRQGRGTGGEGDTPPPNTHEQ